VEKKNDNRKTKRKKRWQIIISAINAEYYTNEMKLRNGLNPTAQKLTNIHDYIYS
jgi:hypothetical protein